MNNKIAVIMPVYNAEKFLKRSLDSLINQDFKSIKIICVNDNSPDNSKKILNEYASDDDRIIVINHETNK